MDNQDYESEHEEPEEKEQNNTDSTDDSETKSKKGWIHTRLKKILMLSGIIFLILLLIFVWLVFTRSGRRVIYKIAGGMIYQSLDRDDDMETSSVIIPLEEKPDINQTDKPENTHDETKNENHGVIQRQKPAPRSEDYVSNYLIFGLEEIDNARNADSIMIASINTKDSSVKLTSLLRDTYIEMDGYSPRKLNAFFGSDGAKTLVKVVEDKYRVKIDGYAYINFESFESIINYLGGIDIELGKEEAEYLNTTNYISNPKYRTVRQGWNTLNGNQALGYCRIRRVETIGGANDDYGRTLRQRRVLGAVFNKYKSKGMLDLLRISNNVLGYVKTNVTQSQIEKGLEDIIENKITTMDTIRVPVNGAFEAPTTYNGIGYPLINDWDKNIIQLYQHIYLDTEEEAKNNLEKYR